MSKLSTEQRSVPRPFESPRQQFMDKCFFLVQRKLLGEIFDFDSGVQTQEAEWKQVNFGIWLKEYAQHFREVVVTCLEKKIKESKDLLDSDGHLLCDEKSLECFYDEVANAVKEAFREDPLREEIFSEKWKAGPVEEDAERKEG